MRLARWLLAGLLALALAGCDDDTTAPRDVTPPAAPRGVRSVTGDTKVYLSWLANTEADVQGYGIYLGEPNATADGPYTRVGTTTGTTFTLNGMANGQTRFLAVSAIDRAGNESALSYDDVFDTPRPEGFGASIANDVQTTVGAGWDFSAGHVVASDAAAADMYYANNGSVAQMFMPWDGSDIQDAGYATSLDAVDYAPAAGWSPTFSVELIPGHCYVVRTADNHYAKFRVTSVSTNSVLFDWAYQVAVANRELGARPALAEGGARRPQVWIR